MKPGDGPHRLSVAAGIRPCALIIRLFALLWINMLLLVVRANERGHAGRRQRRAQRDEERRGVAHTEVEWRLGAPGTTRVCRPKRAR